MRTPRSTFVAAVTVMCGLAAVVPVVVRNSWELSSWLDESLQLTSLVLLGTGALVWLAAEKGKPR
ncbi:hypothetical protein [Actinopolyspora mortivallis]|uniref:hypothetical protein n=1 Tax=Actinopolyspora mortivallis TaxID=33906 RepID=UPI00037A4AE9|nr:hypothetical protein [Actinopolyspora mortivallis]